MTDPFSDLPVWREKFRVSLVKEATDAMLLLAKIAGAMIGGVVLLVLLFGLTTGASIAAAVLGMSIPFAGSKAIAFLKTKIKRIKDCDGAVTKYCLPD